MRLKSENCNQSHNNYFGKYFARQTIVKELQEEELLKILHVWSLEYLKISKVVRRAKTNSEKNGKSSLILIKKLHEESGWK